MAPVVPSFIAKVARAKHHLVELEEEVRRFADTHPYTVGERVEGRKKRKVRFLRLTADPANTDIPIIAADVIYNLRSALDHLMSSMVAADNRGSAMFPVFFQGVWEDAVPGENAQRSKLRSRWESDVKSLPIEAVAILKSLQPSDTSGNDPEPHVLALLNRLSNRDRHEKLPVVAGGMAQMRIEFRQPDGSLARGLANPFPNHVLENHARIHDIPDDAVDVKLSGVPVVGIAMPEKRYVELPRRLGDITKFIETEVFAPLAVHVRR